MISWDLVRSGARLLHEGDRLLEEKEGVDEDDLDLVLQAELADHVHDDAVAGDERGGEERAVARLGDLLQRILQDRKLALEPRVLLRLVRLGVGAFAVRGADRDLREVARVRLDELLVERRGLRGADIFRLTGDQRARASWGEIAHHLGRGGAHLHGRREAGHGRECRGDGREEREAVDHPGDPTRRARRRVSIRPH